MKYFIMRIKFIKAPTKKLLTNILNDFKLSGVHLDADKRKLFRECQEN